jgi:PAS domain-containing protein
LAELEIAHEELRVAEDELRAQQEELRSLAELHQSESWLHEWLVAMLPTAVIVTDGQGIVQTANAAAAELMRVRADVLMRKPIFTVVDRSDRTDLRRLLSRAVASGDGFHTTVTLLPPGADPVEAELATAMAGDGLHGVTRVTWVCLPAEPARDVPTVPAPLLGQCLVELARHGLEAEEVATVLPRMAGLCQQVFPTQTWVSLAVGDAAAPAHVATDSREAQALDGAQMVAGEGPRLTAWLQGRTVTSADVWSDARWPRLTDATGQSPVTTVVATPMRVGESTLGTLTVYGDDEALMSTALIQRAELLAAAVGAVLQATDTKAERALLTRQMEEAMRSRSTIEQAKGLLMATHHCDADEAFRILAQISSRTNVKLRVVAANLLADAVR